MSLYPEKGAADRARLDSAMVTRGLAESRSQARDLVLRGLVRVDGTVASKAGQVVAAAARIEIDGGEERYVARSAGKLAHALDAFQIDVAGTTALDVGASTGGFTQVLLERGARRVYAVDVGQGQLHARIKAVSRVVNLDRMDARELTAAQVPEPIGLIAVDVSFISALAVLPACLKLAGAGANLVVLVKPQFEVGRGGIGKGGVVRDATRREDAVMKVRHWIGDQTGWVVIGDVASPIAGKDGNIEHLIGARRDS